MNKLTDEEVRYNSILETQKSLIELGKQQQEEYNKIKVTESRYKYLENEIATNMTTQILTLKLDDIFKKHLRNDRISNIIELFDIYNEFFVMNRELISNLERHSIKLEDDYNSLREENNQTNKEYDEKQKYWEGRVIKLRAKCIDKNNRISHLEKYELYNVYNIIIKNIFILIMCVCNFDLTEFIYNYLMFIGCMITYSFYTNTRIIIKYNKAKTE